MSTGILRFFGNGKGDRIPPLRVWKLKKLLCFRDRQWKELSRLLVVEPREKRPAKKRFRNKWKDEQSLIYSNAILPELNTEEPFRNLWALSPDEEHIWGDLTREEEMRLQALLKGKNTF